VASAAVRRHWTRVAAIGCVVCGGPAEIAHCHNDSIRERMQEPKAKGKKLPRYDWLVIPLCSLHHRNSVAALDLNVGSFEAAFGTQASHIDRLCEVLGIDLWAKANEGRK